MCLTPDVRRLESYTKSIHRFVRKSCMLQKKKKKLHFLLISELDTNWNAFMAEHGAPASTDASLTCLRYQSPQTDFFPNWLRYSRGIWHLTLTCLSSIGLKVGHFHSWLTSPLTREMTSSPCSRSRFWGAESSNLFMLICKPVTSWGIFETVILYCGMLSACERMPGVYMHIMVQVRYMLFRGDVI